MDFRFEGDQRLFAETVRDILANECPASAVRAAWESETGSVPGLWETLAATGVLGMTAPESAGGLGMSDIDLVLLMEELGRAACPEAVLEHTALVVPLLAESAPAAIADRWMPALVEGTSRASLGLSGYVLGANLADLLVLRNGSELHAVQASTVPLTRHESVDETRRLYSVEWTPSSDSLITRDPAVVSLVESRAAVAAAAQCVGIAQQLLDLTVEYVQERKQFGKPVGVNQAVKHHLANTGKAVEFARPMVHRSAWALSNNSDDAATAAAMAKMLASKAVDLACRTSLQCHGAIAYTVEYDLQLWMKRGWALAAAWGDLTTHRNAVATSLGV